MKTIVADATSETDRCTIETMALIVLRGIIAVLCHSQMGKICKESRVSEKQMVSSNLCETNAASWIAG